MAAPPWRDDHRPHYRGLAHSVVHRVLGVLEMARGLAYQMTDSRTAYIGDAFAWLSNPIAFGISPAFIIALLVIVIAQLVLTRTVFGRYLIGIGTNEEAVRLAGINPKPYKILVFALMGCLPASPRCSRFRAWKRRTRTRRGPGAAVIAAVVIGGTSLMGGVVRSSAPSSAC
jgi:ribose transport system permease protein